MSNLVVKSNELNSITLFKNTLALKIFAKLITVIRENPNDEVFILNIKDLLDDFKGSKDNYTYIKKTLKKMAVVEINEQDFGFTLITTFSKLQAKNGIITFQINNDFKPHITGLLNNFTCYIFENIAGLKSGFSIRIYEILKQWEKVGHKKLTITALRELLKIEKTKYKLYGDFKRKIILVAQKELEEKTDIKFDFEEIKQGRKINEIHFFIKPNHKQTKILENNELDSLFNELEIAQKSKKAILSTYEQERIKRNLEHTKQALEKGKIKTSTIQFLQSALKNDFANQTSLLNSETLKKKQVSQEQEKEKKLELEKKAFYENFNKKIYDYIAENKANLGAFFPELIEKYSFIFNTKNISLDNYQEQQIRDLINTDPKIKALFKNFISEKFFEKKEYDFEEYLKTKNFF